ncbi:SDR family oxidoreductase [Kitasatospora cineracea]|uniref:SDR family oxidoreductase n=1 Tax=Kitasatospora cineracea TaxID=88074 RepID=UPI0036D857B3
MPRPAERPRRRKPPPHAFGLCGRLRRPPDLAADAIARTTLAEGFDFSRDLPERPPPPTAGPVHFWHSAAGMNFQEARRREQFATNTAGTRRAVRLAEQLGAHTFTMISTAYVAGTAEGTVYEAPVERADSRNPYERSKIAAERVLHTYRGPLTIQLMRPSIITGHSRTLLYPGRPSGAYTLQRIIAAYHRRLPADATREQRRILAIPHQPVNLVPIDHVAQEAVAIGRDRRNSGIYHLTNPAPPRVADLVDACFSNAGAAPPHYTTDEASLNGRDRILHNMLAAYRPYLNSPQDFDRTRSDGATPTPAPGWGPAPETLAALLRPHADDR